jgi:hypothetical protein
LQSLNAPEFGKDSLMDRDTADLVGAAVRAVHAARGRAQGLEHRSGV